MIYRISLSQVRKAAFQYLGTFIATFYVPSESDATSVCDDSSLDPLGDSVLMDNSLLPPSPSPEPGKEEEEEEEEEKEEEEEGEREGEEALQPTSIDSKSSTPLQKRGNRRVDKEEEEEEEEKGGGVVPSQSPATILDIGSLELKEEKEIGRAPV